MGSGSSRLTLSGRVGYDHTDWSWCCGRYDASVDEAIARAAVGSLPAHCRRTRFGTGHFPRNTSRASSQSHARHRALHVDVRRRTSPRYGGRPRGGSAHADLSCGDLRAARLFVEFLIPPRLSRSSERFPHIAYSDVANDPVQVFQRAGLV